MAGIAPRRGVSYPWPRPYLTHPPLHVLAPTRPIGQQICGYVRYSVGDPPGLPSVRASQSVRPAARNRQ